VPKDLSGKMTVELVYPLETLELQAESKQIHLD
jgi:hypothetical protein